MPDLSKYIPRISERTVSAFLHGDLKDETRVDEFTSRMRAYIASNPGLSHYTDLMIETSTDPQGVEEAIHGLLNIIASQREADELDLGERL
jgi:hypothetical protein